MTALQTAASNLLSALSGFPVRADAMAGLATGNRTGKPAQREQTVRTPQVIVDACFSVWDAIELDPCSCVGSIVPARENWFGAQVESGRMGKNGPILEWVGQGLELPWLATNYVNPPYAELESWLAKACAETTRGCEVILLGPVRPHRKWWRAAWKDCSEGAWLDCVTFLGHDSSFPAPLALWYWGTHREEFRAGIEALKIGELR